MSLRSDDPADAGPRPVILDAPHHREDVRDIAQSRQAQDANGLRWMFCGLHFISGLTLDGSKRSIGASFTLKAELREAL